MKSSHCILIAEGDQVPNSSTLQVAGKIQIQVLKAKPTGSIKSPEWIIQIDPFTLWSISVPQSLGHDLSISRVDVSSMYSIKT